MIIQKPTIDFLRNLSLRTDHDGPGPKGRLSDGSLCGASLVAADVAAFGIAMTAAWAAAGESFNPRRIVDHMGSLGPDWHGWSVLAIFVGALVYMSQAGEYTRRVPFWMSVRKIWTTSLCALACDCMVSNTLYAAPLHLAPALRWVFFIPAILFCRGVARRLLARSGRWAIRTAMVGDGDVADQVAAALRSQPALGYRVRSAARHEMLAELTTTDSWLEFARSRRAQLVVVAGRHPDAEVHRRSLTALERSGLAFCHVPECDVTPVTRRSPHYFLTHDVTLSVVRKSVDRPLRQTMKQTFDMGVAAGMLLFLAPLFLVLTAIVRMDGGPAFFGHRRIGRGGREFKCLKFRTMRTDSAQVLARLLETDPAAAAEWRETQKLTDDPRITRAGQFLRKTSLDELPQLLNVLRGEMSLVGPRPIVSAEIDRYGDDIDYYYDTRPGLTGLWQVSGRSRTSYVRRVSLDVWYVKNWSLWHDVIILLKTVPALLLRDGAV